VNPEDKIVIIGGGVAGLACGCYLQMNGYRTEILETNRDPGGLCVAWDRGAYVFDGCLRWLTGTDPTSLFHRIWQELGALDGRAIVNEKEFLRVETAEGQVISLSTDLDQLERDFKRLAPEDAALIDNLMRAARRCAPFTPLEKPLEVMTPLEKIMLLFQYLPMMPVILRWKSIGITKYLEAYRNPFLRDVLLAATGDSRMSALVLIMLLGIRCGPNTGYVVGGSRALSESIAQRYTRLGGVIRFNTQAVSVMVQNNRAGGVRCADGTQTPAATVISCADGRTTIFKMLEGRYVNRLILHAYSHYEVFPPLIQASLGINQLFADAPPTLSLAPRRPLMADDQTRVQRMDVSVFGPDSGFCPEGKSVMIVRFPSGYKYWRELKDQRPGDYKKAKARMIQDIVEILEQRFPGVAKHLECSDLATPSSFESWTGNWQGSYQGWLPTPRNLGRRLPHMLPGLKNFYMAGHWVELGGGLPQAAFSGRYVAQMICARDRKAFTASNPS
jgi:phytoene dehydrogenase-like protein